MYMCLYFKALEKVYHHLGLIKVIEDLPASSIVIKDSHHCVISSQDITVIETFIIRYYITRHQRYKKNSTLGWEDEIICMTDLTYNSLQTDI